MSEAWKAVVGYEGLYSVSDQGRVRRDAPGQGSWPGRIILSSPRGCDGRRGVSLVRHGKTTNFYVHMLVILAFVGPCPEGMECCHNDGDPATNVLSNLRWDTRAANYSDSVRHGTNACGERHGCSKLTAADVTEIRMRVSRGEKQRDVAKAFGVVQTNVSLICSGKTWREVQP